MGSCWKQYAKDYLWSIIGEPCGGRGQPSDIVGQMDAISYYNYPKNGIANSCAILCDNALLHACTEPSYDEDPEGAKWTALAAMYEPQSPGANDGAGCRQKVDMFKRAGAWFDDPQDFCEMDEIFFASSDYVSADNPYGVYHTGTIVDWGYIEELGTDGFTVIEGNVNGGVVAYRYYAYSNPRIFGAGRPNWDGWTPGGDDQDSKPDPEPVPEPIPEPTPEPTPTPEPVPLGLYEVVNVTSYLRVRSGPSKDYEVIWKLYNGDQVPIWEIQDGWGRIDDYGWCSMDYLQKIN